MKDFIEIRLPDDISFGAIGGPEYSTSVVTSASGKEQRNINWTHAKVRYNISHGIKNLSQMHDLLSFFRARKGKAIGFRFKDWSDYMALREQIGVADGENKNFQLTKNYQSGEVIEERIIHKPVEGTVSIYINHKLQDESNYTINYATGVIVFKKAPSEGSIITADFQFDIPVRFDSDKLNIVQESHGCYMIQDIGIIEI